MDVLVTYDVNTETRAGRRRLRKVATVCKNYGQRVQLSVFECRVTPAQYEAMRSQLLDNIDPKVDNLRLYKIPAPREKNLEQFGVDLYTDFDDPLII